MAEIKIIGVRIIETTPIGANLLIVRIDTNQPGLYGYGCAQPAGCLAGASRLLLLTRRSRLELRAVRR